MQDPKPFKAPAAETPPPVEKTPLVPTSIEVKVAVAPELPLKKGMVRMVAINAQGDEIGSEFDIPERGLLEGAYSDPARFKLKKKVKP